MDKSKNKATESVDDLVDNVQFDADLPPAVVAELKKRIADDIKKERSAKELQKQREEFSASIDQDYEGSNELWAEAITEEINKPAEKSKRKKKSKKQKKNKVPPPVEEAEAATNTPVEEAEAATNTPVEEAEAATKEQTPPKQVVKKSKDIVISVEVQFIIQNHLRGKVYEGRRVSRLFDNKRSFIEATPSQINNIEELIDVGAQSIFIVSVDHLVESSEVPIPMLVAEHVVPVRSFFEVELERFRSGNHNLDDGSRSKWWTQISQSFHSVFRDVIHGLIYVNSLGYICGDLTNHIYVDAKGVGKILPLMDKTKNEKYDVHNLIQQMVEIITLPFPETEVEDSYKLPDELTHMLKFVTKEKLGPVPFYWLVNHPYIWSTEERINFVMTVKTFVKENLFNEQYINQSLLSRTSHHEFDNQTMDWGLMIDDKLYGGLFKQVYDREHVEGDFKVYNPHRPYDIIRYMTNCYNHGNDYHYQNKNKKNATQKRLTQDDIEASLRSFFPKVYTDLYAAVYDCARMIYSQKMTMNKITRAFEKWSSSYFARKTPVALRDKGKQVFQSVQAGPPIAKPLVPSKQSLSPSLMALSRCAQKLGEELIAIHVEEEVMNQSQNLHFGKDEIGQLLKKNGKLEACHISAYITLLYEDCVKNGLTKTFGFLCPSSISSSIRSENAKLIETDREVRSNYILNALHDGASDGKVYIAPYNIRDHWILCLINPFARIVYYLDSLTGQGSEIEEDIRSVVDIALSKYLNQPGKSVTWKQIKCPQQNNTYACGYYVLRFMREIVDHQTIEIPETYFADHARANYDQRQINE